MRIKKLVTNIKGRAINADLEPLTAITGPNWSGKTSHVDAIQLAMSGWHPNAGKQNQAIFKFAKGTDLTTAITLDDGRTVSRNWELKRGAVKRTENVPGGLEIPDVLIDARAFLGLSGKKRTEYLMGILDMSKVEITGTTLRTDLKAINLGKKHTDDHTTALNAVDALVAAKGDAPLHEWIDELMKQFKENGKGAAEANKRMIGLIEGAEQLSDEASVDPAVEAKQEANARALKENLSRQQDLRGKLSAYNEAKAKIDALQSQMVNPDVKAHNEKQDALGKLEEEVEAYRPKAPALQAQLPELQKALGTESEKTRAIAKDHKDVQLQLDELVHMTECPFCKVSSEGWDTNLKVTLETRFKELDTALNEALAAREKIEAQIAKVKTELQEAQESDDAVRGKQISLGHQRSDLKRTAADIEADRKRKATIDTAKDTVKDATPDDWAADLATEQAAYAHLEQTNTELQAQVKLLITKREKTKQRAKAEAQSAICAAEVAIYKAAVKVVEETKDKLVKATFGPLITKLNEIGGCLLQTPLDYRDGDLGRWDGRDWIPFDAFGGSEKAIAMAAVAVTLAVQSPIKLVMIDDIGVCQHSVRADLVHHMATLIEKGIIDQCILTDWETRFYGSGDMPEALHVIEL